MEILSFKPHPWTGKPWFAALWTMVTFVLVKAYLIEPRSPVRGALLLIAAINFVAQWRAVYHARLTAGKPNG